MKPTLSQFLILGREYSTTKKHGAYSYYIKISPKLGIKILNRNKYICKTERALKKSGLWKTAMREFNLLGELSGTGLTPQAHEIVICQDLQTGNLYPGILMEHITGKGLSFWYHKNKEKKYLFRGQKYLAWNLQKKIHQFLLKKKVNHRDLHFGNILVNKFGIVRVIDLGLANRVK